MTEEEKLEFLYDVCNHLIDTDFKPEPMESFVMNSIVIGHDHRTSILFSNPLMVYKGLFFSHNFLFHIWKDEYMFRGKEMLEMRDPIKYLKMNWKNER